MPRTLTSLIASLFTIALHAQAWQSMADMPFSLAFPVVVELQGNIHVIGGGGGNGAMDVHLRYTPANNTWDNLAQVPYLAQQPCGAVVNGKIHFCGGGYPNSGTPLNDHHVYDPTTDTWTQAADLPFPTVINEAASVDGKLFVLSGQPDKQLCQSYDPATDSWTAHDPLPDMNFWYGAVLAANNTMYRFGGGGYMTPTDAAHVYDAANDNWNALPDVPATVHALAGANIDDSLICLAGGYFNFAELDNVWLYHLNTQQYEVMDPLPVPRAYHALVRAGGCLYAVGGNNANDPTVGVSLLKNCTIGVSVPTIAATTTLPYSMVITTSTVQVQLASGTSHALIEVVDAAGRTVAQHEAAHGAVTISGTHYPAGVYTIVITIEGRKYAEAWARVR